MLSAIVFLPALAAAGLLAVPARAPRAVFLWAWVGVSAAGLALVVAAWAGYRPHGGFGWTEDVRWIPSAGVGYHVGVDGLSLPLLAMTAVLFLAVAVYSLRETRRPKSYVCLFLFLQTVSLGLFAALDLILFFLFFDLSIVGMYFVIAGWGHGERARAAALKFFLYTFTGSLALLLGFIGLYLAVRPHTFAVLEDLDARELTNHVLVISRHQMKPCDIERLNHLRPFDPVMLQRVRVLVGVGGADGNPADVVRAWDAVGGTTRIERASWDEAEQPRIPRRSTSMLPCPAPPARCSTRCSACGGSSDSPQRRKRASPSSRGRPTARKKPSPWRSSFRHRCSS